MFDTPARQGKPTRFASRPQHDDVARPRAIGRHRARRGATLWAAMASMLAVALFATGCGTPTGGDRVLQIASPREITSLDPRDTGFHFRRLGVLETLVSINPEGDIVGQLAQSWEVSADRLQWRFKIRAGVKFHDGSAADAATILASLQRVLPKSEMAKTAPIAEFATDGDEIVLTTTRPFNLLPAYLSDGSVPILAPASWGTDGTVRSIIGTGPYRVVQIDGKDGVDMESFADYWGPKPAIPAVHFSAVESPDTLANLIESGQADVVYALPAIIKNRLQSAPDIGVETVTTARTFLLRFNVAQPFFSDVRVRQALSASLDRRGIAETIYGNEDAAAYQLISPALPDWHDPSIDPTGRDVEGAKRLLNEAGWVAGPDGVLTKDGRRFAFTLFVGPDPQSATVGEAVQSQFRDIGVEMTVQTGKWAVQLEQAKHNTDEAGTSGRNYGQVPDAIGMLRVDNGKENEAEHFYGGRNYDNPALEQAFNDYLGASDPGAQDAARQRIVEIYHTDLPVIPVAYVDYSVAFSPRVAPDSITLDSLEYSYWVDRVKWA